MILSAEQIRRSAERIAGEQQPSGLVPWFAGGPADPWDHVEAAMALTATGRLREARAAFRWSAATQAADGSWPMELGAVGAVLDDATDVNRCAYVAAGVWHHWLVTRDAPFVRSMWPTVRRAADLACELQQPSGVISWARSASGAVATEALLTGNACLVLSLRCALALSELVGDPRPEWELAVARLAHVVAVHPEAFADRSRFSMDWYYPVLGGAVQGAAAREHLAGRWEEFVEPGRGARCVADRPWVTAAETAELVLALDAAGETAQAMRLLRDVQFCRTDDGRYWTGWVFPEAVHWPQETSTWTAAAILLADDALARRSAGHALFRGAGLAPLLEFGGCDRYCGARV